MVSVVDTRVSSADRQTRDVCGDGDGGGGDDDELMSV